MGLKPIIALLGSDHNETVANCVTTLIYLFNEQTKSEINTYDTTLLVQNLAKSDDKMLANLATVFLQDICQISN